MPFELQAPAKVNLCLSVQYPPKDGFHQLDSVFQAITLHDSLYFAVRPCAARCARFKTSMGTPVIVECEGLDLPLSENLVFKALDAAEQACGIAVAPAGEEFYIEVDKGIPAGGGLGGGSSDAATTLKAYARIVGIDERDPRLLDVARSLGADVAFFLQGGCALMTGRGDVLERALPSPELALVLMGDSEGSSTPQVYAAFDEGPQPTPDAFALAAALESPEVESAELAALYANNLEQAACQVQPRIAERLEAARADDDVLTALVSGSGATCFAICVDDVAARRFAKAIEPSCDWVTVAHAL